MRSIAVFSLLILFCSNHTLSQLLATTPDFPTDNSSITITMDAAKGNKGLLGFAGSVYVHTGVITSASTDPNDWKYVQGTWGTTNAPLANSIGGNKWSFNISNIRQYYGVASGEKILKIVVLFRNQAGTRVQRNIDGSDMYIQIYEQGTFNAKFVEPLMQPTFIPIPDPIPSTATTLNARVVTSLSANIDLRFNGTQIGQISNATSLRGTANITQPCEQFLSYEAVGSSTLRDTISFFINPPSNPTGARPTGLKDGITFQNNNTEAVFILFAPGKTRMHLVGDFNNWRETCAGLMRKDGDYFWARITGLTPGKSYRFQYLIEDSIRIADPYSELVLDPNNDRFIPTVAYPNMPEYPVGKTPGGYVGLFTPGETPFNWTSDASYRRPNKYDLMIYELHMRDFVRNESYQSLIDTLPYLIQLGFNAIQLMPINEFDGNNSWGYNPSYYFAPDKAYGPKQKLKEFIDKAHSNGIAVIMDVAFNQASDQSPFARMWWNTGANKPAANNPYFNPDARHPFNVYNDFNHNSPATRTHVERFIEYWLKEYKIDGFRWDLSKGFTPSDYPCSPNDVNCWGQFSQGRINILQNYYNKMQVASPGSYCILEHFAEDAEEYELAKSGMLLWGKMNAEFNENTMGTTRNKDISRAYWMNRSVWNNPGNTAIISDKPGLITYAESHDEERIMYKNITFGNTLFRDTITALSRTEAMAAVLMAIPGPKMIWQFGELGYETSISACPPFPFNPNGNWTVPQPYNEFGSCRNQRKPNRWNYYYDNNIANNARKKIFNVYASMAKLRKKYPNAFNRATLANGTFMLDDLWKAVVVDHADLKMVVVANFFGNAVTRSQPFPDNGIWYDYMNGGTISVTNNNFNVNVPAHGYKIYINKSESSITTNITDLRESLDIIKIYPNPTHDMLQVSYESSKSSVGELILIDISGRILSKQSIGIKTGSNQYVMNLSQNITSGNYILMLKTQQFQKQMKITVVR